MVLNDTVLLEGKTMNKTLFLSCVLVLSGSAAAMQQAKSESHAAPDALQHRVHRHAAQAVHGATAPVQRAYQGFMGADRTGKIDMAINAGAAVCILGGFYLLAQWLIYDAETVVTTGYRP